MPFGIPSEDFHGGFGLPHEDDEPEYKQEFRSVETQVTLNVINHIFNDVLDLIVEHANSNPQKRLTVDFLTDYNKLREEYIKRWDI